MTPRKINMKSENTGPWKGKNIIRTINFRFAAARCRSARKEPQQPVQEGRRVSLGRGHDQCCSIVGPQIDDLAAISNIYPFSSALLGEHFQCWLICVQEKVTLGENVLIVERKIWVFQPANQMIQNEWVHGLRPTMLRCTRKHCFGMMGIPAIRANRSMVVS